jgi:hypothetical protein
MYNIDNCFFEKHQTLWMLYCLSIIATHLNLQDERIFA